MSRTFFPNGGSNAPPTFKYKPLSDIYKTDLNCFRCKYKASTEDEPLVQKAFTEIEQLIRETQGVNPDIRANEIAKLYEEKVRQYVPGHPEWSKETVQACLTGRHGSTDPTVIIQNGITELGFLVLASSSRLARINAQTDEFDGPNIAEAKFLMEVLRTVQQLKS